MIAVGICTNIDVRESILFWVQIISAVGSVGAVIFAAWTIHEARKSATASATALVRERRIDFELDVLRDIHSLINDLSRSGGRLKAQIRPLLKLLPNARLDYTGKAVAVVRADSELQWPTGDVRGEASREIEAEMLRLIAERA